MNGGGKLWHDPTGSSDFVGRIGRSIHFAVSSTATQVTVASATYGERLLPVEGQSVRFVIVEGEATFSLLLSSDGNNREVGLFQEVGPGAFALLTVLLLRQNAARFEFTIRGIR